MKISRVLPEFDSAARTAIVTGDADRIAVFANALGGTTRTWRTRELVVTEVAGDGDDTPILLACHGQGGFSTAILVEELIDSGIRAIVRVGSCGPLQPHVAMGSVVISTGVVRDDGTSASYLPVEVPAIPDIELVHALATLLRDTGVGCTLGLTHCKDAYYAADPSRRVLGRDWQQRYALLENLGVLATEAEAGALFAIAAVRRIRAAALFVVGAAAESANPLMLRCAITAAKAMRHTLEEASGY